MKAKSRHKCHWGLKKGSRLSTVCHGRQPSMVTPSCYSSHCAHFIDDKTQFYRRSDHQRDREWKSWDLQLGLPNFWLESFPKCLWFQASLPTSATCPLSTGRKGSPEPVSLSSFATALAPHSSRPTPFSQKTCWIRAQNEKESESNWSSDIRGAPSGLRKQSLGYRQAAEGFGQDGRQGITGARLQSRVLGILQGSGQRAVQHHSPEHHHLEQGHS